MRVKIIDSFGEAGATPVQRGCVMEVPELTARVWIRIKRAVAFPLPVTRPPKIAGDLPGTDEQPSSRPVALEMPTSRKKARR